MRTNFAPRSEGQKDWRLIHCNNQTSDSIFFFLCKQPLYGCAMSQLYHNSHFVPLHILQASNMPKSWIKPGYLLGTINQEILLSGLALALVRPDVGEGCIEEHVWACPPVTATARWQARAGHPPHPPVAWASSAAQWPEEAEQSQLSAHLLACSFPSGCLWLGRQMGSPGATPRRRWGDWRQASHGARDARQATSPCHPHLPAPKANANSSCSRGVTRSVTQLTSSWDSCAQHTGGGGVAL